MAGVHVSAVLEGQHDHRGPELCVLLTIASHINYDSDEAFPSVPRIARLARLGVRRVQYALRSLQQSGALCVEHSAGPGGAHRYRLGVELQELANSLKPAKDRKGNVVHMHAPPGARTVHPPGCTQDAPPGADSVHPGGAQAHAPESELNRKENLSETDMGVKEKARTIAAQLREEGAVTAKATEALVQAVRLGAALEDCRSAVDAAVASGADDPFAYGMRVLLNRLERAAASGPMQAVNWDNVPRSYVEARAREVGMQPWDDGVTVQWGPYKASVKARVEAARAAEVSSAAAVAGTQ